MPTFGRKNIDEIIYLGDIYRFTFHPNIPHLYYEVGGRTGKVYKLSKGQEYFAFKQYFPAFQTSDLANRNMQLSQFRGLHGLKVLDRKTLLSNWPPSLEVPEFINGIITPWIDGKVWGEYLRSETALSDLVSLSLAKALVNLLANLEKIGVAHCNLSADNLIVENDDFTKVQLVGVEHLYYKFLTIPEAIITGSLGYIPAGYYDRNLGLYCQESDRFSGSILLAEIFCWQFPEIIGKKYCESSYFDQREMGEKSYRYQLLNKYLSSIDTNLGLLFSQAWYADNLRECPTLDQWKVTIDKIQLPTSNKLISTNFQPAKPSNSSTLIEIDQNIDTNLQETKNESGISVRYAYFRSSENRISNHVGQDYLAFQLTTDMAVFAICDGVGASFKGEIAAHMLGEFLIKCLCEISSEDAFISSEKSVDNQKRIGNLISIIESGLINLCKDATKVIDDMNLDEIDSEFLKEALKQQRSKFGSQTNFACGLIETPNDHFPVGRLLLFWLGDVKLRLYYGCNDKTDLLDKKCDLNGRWSSITGIIDGPIQGFMSELEQDCTLILHSDGLYPFPSWDYKPHSPGVLESFFQAMAEDPQNMDDVSFIEINISKENMSYNPNSKRP